MNHHKAEWLDKALQTLIVVFLVVFLVAAAVEGGSKPRRGRTGQPAGRTGQEFVPVQPAESERAR